MLLKKRIQVSCELGHIEWVVLGGFRVHLPPPYLSVLISLFHGDRKELKNTQLLSIKSFFSFNDMQVFGLLKENISTKENCLFHFQKNSIL